MNNRIMIKVTVSEECVSFRTISRQRKSPHRFVVLKEDFKRLNTEQTIVLRDMASFAVFRRDKADDTLTIQFNWLDHCEGTLRGYREEVTLPFYGLERFIDFCMAGAERSYLSMERRPHVEYTFFAKETLHSIIANKTIRRKFVRFLRNNFRWNDADEICFFSDFVPYSFFFRCIRNGHCELTGGVILHGQENMATAKYSLHT